MSLRGVRIAVTRPEGQASDLMRALEDEGAHVLAVPLIRVVRAEDPAPLERAARRIGSFDWIVFTSVNAVRFFMEALARTDAPPQQALAHVAVACVGPATADALRTAGVAIDAMPDEFVGDALAGAMARAGRLAGSCVLWPRAAGARTTIAEMLRAAGAEVDDPVAYRSEPDVAGARRLAEVVLQKGVDVVTFASPSAVHALVSELADPGEVEVAAIGPVTAAAARVAGYRVRVVSEEYTAAGLVAALRMRFMDNDDVVQEES